MSTDGLAEGIGEGAYAVIFTSLRMPVAQRAGRERWYRAYRVRVCRIERAHAFDR
jgi:hypothetical protein